MKYYEPMKFDSIVVGGGIAGLTAACYLCRYGHNVLLLEKSKKVGGLVDRLKEMASSLIMVHELSKTRASSCPC